MCEPIYLNTLNIFLSLFIAWACFRNVMLLVLFVFAVVLPVFSIRLRAELIKVECDCKVATSLEQEEYFEF